jgi:hypothetical protein
MKNAFVKDYAGKRAATGKPKSGPTHGKSLGGVGIECGDGTLATNDMFQASVSTRGMKEAMNPKGPSGS